MWNGTHELICYDYYHISHVFQGLLFSSKKFFPCLTTVTNGY
jgi:hypothetical protein